MSRTYHHHHRQMHWAGPGWWHHLMTEVKARRRVRDLSRLAVRTKDLDEVDRVHWPLARKPHIYFW